MCAYPLLQRHTENCPCLMSKMSVFERKSKKCDFLSELRMDYWTVGYIKYVDYLI